MHFTERERAPQTLSSPAAPNHNNSPPGTKDSYTHPTTPSAGRTGGVLFSLADTVSGTAAAASGEYRVTTVNGSINYLRAGKNTSKITAEAVEIKNGKTFSVCDSKIYDDKGALLATTTMTFYHLLPR